VDFIESGSWDSLKWGVIQAVLGMGNLRDGGMIIIGVSERGNSWELTGISPQDLSGYDVDILKDQVNAYVSPHADLDVVIVEYRDGKRFLVLRVKEFLDTPLVCKKNGPTGSGLVEGGLYVRAPGMARTTRVTNASQMHDLLDLAAEKRARRILEVGKRVGLVPGASAGEKFDEELEGL
jgi:predicted HTH transcriptional regulator